MQFRYIGEYPTGQRSAVFWGFPFEAGGVTDVPEALAATFLRNRYFERVENAPAETTPDADQPPTREELIAIAEANSIKIDKRWSYDRLAQAVIAHSKDLP